MLNQFLPQLQELATPVYHYNLAVLKETLKEAKTQAARHNFEVHYALKANSNNTILQLVREAGFGADCVSGNEVRKAIECGFTPGQIVFAGVGKSDEEILFALEQNIFCFNSESVQELEVINELAAQTNTKARIALRINPNVNANTHHYITTGLEENKFGINIWELENVLELLQSQPNLELIGLHFHIGSQITDLEPFRNLCLRVNELQEWFMARNIALSHLNLGGGLGVDYYQPDVHLLPDFKAYFDVFNRFLNRKPGQQVHFELGRALVAQCGTLLSRVLYVKKGINTNFLILDAGMTELIRPALYQSYHKIENLTSQLPEQRYDVVGPICESSDCFGKAVMLPEAKRGDLVAIRTAGAYGEVMSSGYNLRTRVQAVYEEGETGKATF